jgi:hypothetical protein
MRIIVELLRENGELTSKINRNQATSIKTNLTHVIKSAARARPKSAKPNQDLEAQIARPTAVPTTFLGQLQKPPEEEKAPAEVILSDKNKLFMD